MNPESYRNLVGFLESLRGPSSPWLPSQWTADVLVDNVPVGRIGEGEIFGAMAALTHADRSATVKARTACSVAASSSR
mgnify:CR=1 FL=1